MKTENQSRISCVTELFASWVICMLLSEMGRAVEIEKIAGNRKNDLVAVEGCLFEKNKNIVGGTSYRCIKKEPGTRKRCPAILHLKTCASVLILSCTRSVQER